MKKIYVLLLILSIMSCKKDESSGLTNASESVYAVSLFSVGKVLLGDREFKIKDILRLAEELQLEPRTLCDLQIAKRDWLIRIKGVATFKLNSIKMNDATEQKFYLERGIGLFKIGSKLKSNEQFNVITPTALLGVRGTQFLVDVAEDGTTQITVLDGKVAIHLIADKNVEAGSFSKLNGFFIDNEIILEKNSRLTINKESYKKFQNVAGAKPEELIKLFSVIQTKQITVIPAKEKSLLEAEFSGLSFLTNESFKDTETLKMAVEARAIEKSPELLKVMASHAGMKLGILTLVSGEEIHGFIKQDGKTWKIETVLETKTFQEKEVMSVDYDNEK